MSTLLERRREMLTFKDNFDNYQEVEYIHMERARIDLQRGLVNSTLPGIHIHSDFEYTGVHQEHSNQDVFRLGGSDTPEGQGCYRFAMSSNRSVKFWAGNNAIVQTRAYITLNKKDSMDLVFGHLYWNNKDYTQTVQIDYKEIYSKIFFLGSDCYVKIYTFTIDDNSTPILDLKPCYRKSDGVAGLYDIVHNRFFSNALSTGTITPGPDIN